MSFLFVIEFRSQRVIDDLKIDVTYINVLMEILCFK